MPAPREQRFERREELLDFLLDVSTAASDTLDLERILASVAEIVRKVVPFDLYALFLYSERLQALRIRHAIGHREEVVRSLLLTPGEGVVGIAAQTRQAILVPDVRRDPRYISGVDAVRSELSVPMLNRGRLVGVIDLESTRVNAYTEQDRSLLRLIASRVATSIDNARLFRRADRQYRTLRTLARISQEITSILALDELFSKIAQNVRELISFDAFSLLLLDEENRILKNRFSLRYDQRVEWEHIPLGLGITGAAVASRKPVRVDDTLSDQRYIATTQGILSEVAVPLLVRDRVIGVMDLESERLGFFNDEHVRTLSLLAPQIAISIENARLYEEIAQRKHSMEQDLMAARKLQRVLLPRKAPPIQGLEIAVRSRPAREISGDIYDFFDYGSHAVMCCGDSSGKGAAAALYSALVSGVLRTVASTESSPAEMMRLVNEELVERKVDAFFVTLLVLLWRPQTREVFLASAGMFPPIVLRKGEIVGPRVEGVPLGLLDNRYYDEERFPTEPGDVILLYSDGVEDQVNAAEEEYGSKRLARLLRQHGGRDVRAIADAVFEDLDAYAGGLPISDDQTLIVIRVKE